MYTFSHSTIFVTSFDQLSFISLLCFTSILILFYFIIVDINDNGPVCRGCRIFTGHDRLHLHGNCCMLTINDKKWMQLDWWSFSVDILWQLWFDQSASKAHTCITPRTCMLRCSHGMQREAIDIHAYVSMYFISDNFVPSHNHSIHYLYNIKQYNSILCIHRDSMQLARWGGRRTCSLRVPVL